MNPKQGVTLLAIWIAAIAASGAAALLKGGLYLDGFEDGAAHLIQVLALMAEGHVPHRDFMTPIGVLAFWPMALGVERGMPIGMSFHWAQMGLALAMLPLLWWVAVSRLNFRQGLWFGIAALIMVMALTDGDGQHLAVAGHHGRWGWAFAFIAVALAVLGPEYRRGGVLDGFALGVCLSVLALLEAAFFVGIAPGVVFALAMRRQFAAMGMAALVGVAAVLGANTAFGPTVLWDYLGDLLRAGGTTTPPHPGVSFAEFLIAPRFIAGTILLASAVWVLRRAGRRTEAAALLPLAAGFLWIGFRSQENDPLWPLILAVVLFASHPRRAFPDARGPDPKVAAVAFASVVAAAGPWIDFAASPFRHFSADPSGHVQLLPELPMARDIHFARAVVEDPEVAIRRSPRIGLGAPPGTMPGDAFFLGEPLPRCRGGDIIDAQRRIAAEVAVREAPDENARIFVADVFSALWLVGLGEPVEGIAPWNYGELLGFGTADYLLVPLCPLRPDVRSELLSAIEAESADSLVEVARGEALILYRIDR